MGHNKMVCAFPGQGIQKPGMAQAFVNTQAWDLFEEASVILGYDLGELCLQGPVERLNNTAQAQVAIFVTCYALWNLKKENLQPDYFVGHSLGEVTALAAAGAFSFASGVELVARRGEIMAKLAPTGGMSAVLGLELEQVQELCIEASAENYVQVANVNSPQQIVVSGELAGLELLRELALKEGARQVVPLNVSGPFHSKLMEPAAKEFAQIVEKLELYPCQTPVLSNDGFSLLQDKASIKKALVAQLTKPVYFVQTVQKLDALGVQEFVEISPQAILTGLAKRIVPKLQFTLVSEGGM